MRRIIEILNKLGGKLNIKQLITQYLEYLEIEKGRSLLTVRNYDHYLRDFAGFAKVNKIESPEQINLALIHQYRMKLNRTEAHHTSEALTHKTQNYYLIALRSFLKYLGKIEISSLAPEKVELAKNEDRQITFLDNDELISLLNQPDLQKIQGARDSAIMNLLFSTGLRVSELSTLKKEDINLEKNEFSVRGKGGKIRVVFLDQEAKEAIKRYLALRRDKSEYLFISYGHCNSVDGRRLTVDEPITPRSVQRMIQKYARQAGITKNVTPHVMRHSFATDLLMNGADIRSVQALLGHASINTTQVYTHVTDQHLQEVHQAFHGLRRDDEEISDDNHDINDELDSGQREEIDIN